MASKRQGFNRLSDNGASSSDREMQIDDYESGKQKRYLVKDSHDPDSEEAVCYKPLTRREYACLGIGVAVLVAAVFVFLIIGLSVRGGPSTQPWEQVRLPRSILPQLYTIHLEPDFDSFIVKGSVSIMSLVNSSTSVIVFHSKDMNISDVVVTRDDAKLSMKRVFNHSENDFVVIELSDQLIKGQTVTISMNYNYTLRKDLIGFYRSSYVAQDGQKRYLATTQFEPTDARRAFPCFDEPAMKANFSISLTHRSDYTAVSNMPVDTVTSADSSRSRTTFQTSYKMSTYLVAFVVSDFNCSAPSTTSSGVKVGVTLNNNL